MTGAECLSIVHHLSFLTLEDNPASGARYPELREICAKSDSSRDISYLGYAEAAKDLLWLAVADCPDRAEAEKLAQIAEQLRDRLGKRGEKR